jgi:hypothetical protein
MDRSLTAEIAASSLRMANPSWKVFAEGDSDHCGTNHGDADFARGTCAYA